MMERHGVHRFVIVGGGFTAAAFVIHAIRAFRGRVAFDVIEPADALGRGIAYATRDPLHRINVPSDRMSLVPEDGEHATRWFLREGILPGDGSSDDGDGAWYVPRWHYGSYVGDVLAKTVREAGGRAALRHHRRRAVDVASKGADWTIRLDDGGTLDADGLVLAFGHAAPSRPFPVSDAVLAHPGWVAEPWRDGAVGRIDAVRAVLIVGSGLTMADMVETILARGHRGPVAVVSRHGLLPQPHGLFRADDFLEGAPPPCTALSLLHLARERARQAAASGLGWQVAADALRFQLGAIWPALPVTEKAKVVRRLLPFWDTHRFRIAPQPDRTLRRAIASGQVSVGRGAVFGVDRRGGDLVATLRVGGTKVERSFGAVILCVGPGRDLAADPFVARLIARGIARLDALRLGLDVTAESALVAGDGSVHATAMALGPMTRASFGEMTGAPDIVRHVQALAIDLASRAEQETEWLS